MRLPRYSNSCLPITVLLLLFFSLVFFGCSSSNCASNPLKNIDRYQVALFISPYGDLNEEKIKKNLKEKLSSIGQVIEAKVPIAEENPLLFISIEPKGEFSSSIRVIGKVKVIKNGCELTSVIWSHSLEVDEVSIPIERNGTVSFEKRKKTLSQDNPLDSLLTAFVEEYKAAHPKQAPITFLISE